MTSTPTPAEPTCPHLHQDFPGTAVNKCLDCGAAPHSRSERAEVLEEVIIVEILAPDGTVHYRRPWNDPDVQEAFNTLGYSVRKAQ